MAKHTQTIRCKKNHKKNTHTQNQQKRKKKQEVVNDLSVCVLNILPKVSPPCQF